MTGPGTTPHYVSGPMQVERLREPSWARSLAFDDAALECERAGRETAFSVTSSVEMKKGYQAACDLIAMSLRVMASKAAPTPSLQTGGEGLDEADAEIARIMALSDEEVLAEAAPEDLAWAKLFRARMIAIKHALPGRYDGISTYATIRGDADEKPYMIAIRDALTPSGVEGETVPSIPAGGWRTALRNALDANVPVGTVDARLRDAIICNVVDAFRRSLATPFTTRETVPGDEWVMVPREPTEAMLDALARQAQKPTGWHNVYPAMYRALLAASPKLTTGASSEEVERLRKALESAVGILKLKRRGIMQGYDLTGCIERGESALSASSPTPDQSNLSGGEG